MEKVYIFLIIILTLFFQGCTKKEEIIERGNNNIIENSTIDENMYERIDKKIDEILGNYIRKRLLQIFVTAFFSCYSLFK